MARAISKGGWTHIRYAHCRRPTRLDVACPRCGGLAHATKTSEVGLSTFTNDCSGTWDKNDWNVVCTSCVYRASHLSYELLPPCYWQVEVGALLVWAWNRDHLSFLARYLNGDDISGDAYAGLATYVPGDWKAAGKRVATTLMATLAQAT